MEIFSATEATFAYIMTIVVFSAGILFLALIVGVALYSMITEKNFDLSGIVVVIVVLALATLGTFQLINTFKKGAEVTYKATVFDFNEVYENGYEIIGQDGKLYILKKVYNVK